MAARKEETVVGDVLELKALALDKARVRALWFDPEVAKRACSSALLLVEGHSKQIGKEHPGFDLEAFRILPKVCDRILVIQRELEAARVAELGLTTQRVAESLEWRRGLLLLADTLAAVGKVNPNEVARIRQGLGATDNVRDVIELVALLLGHEEAVAATIGKGALEKAHAVATRAFESLNTGSPAELRRQQMTNLRDRYGTLVSEGHERMRLAIAVIFSPAEADRLVGSLRPQTARRTSGQTDSGGVESPPEPGPA